TEPFPTGIADGRYGAFFAVAIACTEGLLWVDCGPSVSVGNRQQWVESECGAVAVGRTYLLPPLASGGASLVRPWLRFHTPLIGRVEDWRAGLGRCRATSPVPSTSNAACGFPALRSPICFTSRLIGPILPGRLSACRGALDSR